MARAIEALNLLRMNDPQRLGDWFGRFITQYRSATVAAPPGRARSRIEVEWDLQQGDRLLRHPWSRMAWRRSGKAARLYVSGDAFDLPVRDARRIAAAGELDGATYSALGDAARDVVMQLMEGGHYQLQLDDDD